MLRHQCYAVAFPRLKQNPTVFHDLGKCRSCAHRERPLQLSTQIAKYCHNVQCTALKYYKVATFTTTALQASASLQHSIEDDVSDGGNATGGPVSRVQGRQLGGRAMQSVVVVGSVGGRGGGRRTQKTTNVKR